MGNAHVLSTRVGHRANQDAPLEFLPENASITGYEGIEPAQLCVQMKIDKTIKLESTVFKWIAVDTLGAPPDTLIISVKVPLAMENLTSYCSLPRPWPVGSYRVDVFVGDKLMGGVPFVVQPKQYDAGLVQEVTLAHKGEDNLKHEFRGEAKANAGLLFVEFKLAQAVFLRENSYVAWIATDCKEAPPNTVIATSPLPVGSFTKCNSDVSLPRDWPVGKYNVQLFIDGLLVKSEPFEIKQ